MTTVIGLVGGPGSGKSTMAAEIFARMKVARLSVELVTEYVKSWAWAGRTIDKFDTPLIFGKQLSREAALYGRVKYIVTDKPLELSAVYDPWLRGLVEHMIQERALRGVEDRLFFVRRNKPYVSDGRYQTEDEARRVDSAMAAHIPCETTVDCADDVLTHLGLDA